MYCQKCGTELNQDGRCENCNPSPYTPEFIEEPIREAEPKASNGSRMTGFGKALTAMILSFVAFVFAYASLIALGTFMGAFESSDYLYDYEYIASTVGVCSFFALSSVGLCIPTIILGIQSIKTFIREKKAGRLTPIATLVLGIASLTDVPATLLFSLITFVLSILFI